MVREVMSRGRFGILLDFPSEATVNTVPHISTFKAESIEDYETAFVDDRKMLTRAHLASDKNFDGADVTHELILENTIYKFCRFIRDQHKDRVDMGDEISPTVNGRALPYIPFLMVSHEGPRPDHVTPPFLSLCQVALSHFKNSCDREHAIYPAASPMPWVAGALPADKVPTQIGAGTIWLLEYSTAGRRRRSRRHRTGRGKTEPRPHAPRCRVRKYSASRRASWAWSEGGMVLRNRSKTDRAIE